MLINGFHPIIEELPFGPVLLCVLPLHFENEIHAIRQTNQEVRAILLHDTLPDVENLEAEMMPAA